MKVIDLLNKIANGEEVPKKIRIDHWVYKFEWVEHISNYYDKRVDIDLMSCLSMDKEELNYEIHEIKEEKKIHKIKEEKEIPEKLNISNFPRHNNSLKKTAIKVNEIIDYLKSKGE